MTGLSLVRPGEGWMDEALCREMAAGGDLFFPEHAAGIAAAKEACSHCPVRAECLEYAISYQITHGVWGGASEEDRRVMRAGPGLCGNGLHVMDAANTAITTSGNRKCRACRNAASARSRRRRRQREEERAALCPGMALGPRQAAAGTAFSRLSP